MSKLYRSETDKMIAGVAGGLGEYFNIDSSLIRILFVLITLLGGSGILLYLVLWLIIPSKVNQGKLDSDTIKHNVQEMKERAQSFTSGIKKGHKKHDSRNWFAFVIIILGVVFLLENLGLVEPFLIRKFWPLILIFFGLAVFFKNE